MIYFDNAASSFPKPKCVAKSMNDWMKNNGANPGRSGHDLSVRASEIIYDTRVNLARLFGVEQVENIAFVPNATFGLNMLIQGLVSRGDHIIISDLEHNSVIRPVYLKSMSGVDYSVAETDLYDDNQTVDNFLNLVKHNTKVVVCTQCSNVCGKVMPVKLLRQKLPKQIKLIVDGSQGAGIIPTNLAKLGVDYYCAPSHKGLMGPQGCGFIAVRSELPSAIICGGTGSDSFNYEQPDYMPDLLECGTLPTPIIVGMNSSVKFIESVGIDNIYQHKKRLTNYFYSSISNVDKVIRYVDYDKGSFVGVACINIDSVESDIVGNYLNEKGICVRSGIHCAPLFHKKMCTEECGMIRISFGCFNTKEEIDFLVKTLKKF